MANIPPPPQTQPVTQPRSGLLSLPWNLWLQAFIKAVQDIIDSLYLRRYDSAIPLPHDHATGSAVDLSDQPISEGTSTLLARADHVHLKLIQAEDDGVDIGSVSAINVLTPGLDVAFEPNLTGALPGKIYARWALDETSGTRYKTEGTATSADLAEAVASVASAAGKFGNAVDCTPATTSYLENTSLTPSFDASSDYTISVWFYVPAFVSTEPKSLMLLSKTGNVGIGANRYKESGVDVIATYMQWGPALTDATYAGFTQSLGYYPTNTWNILFLWKEGLRFWSQVNLNAPAPGDVVMSGGQVAAFSGLDRLWITGAWRAGYVNWDGRLDDFIIWNTALTGAERARVYKNYRASISANPYFAQTYGG